MSAAIDLSGRVALVTGAAGGIGGATVAALEDAGATVIAIDLVAHPHPSGAGAPPSLSQREREQLAAGERKGEGDLVPLDVTSEAAWTRVAARIEREHGALDILIHNAGLVLVKPLAATTPEDWRRLFAVNVDGPYLGTRALLPLLKAGAKRQSSGAAVVLLSSVAGIGGGARMSGYCATKGAVRLFAKACAMEFAPDRIRVNSVHPGGVDTPMIGEIVDAYAAQGLSPDAATARDRLAAAHPLGRLVTPDEVARAIRFLASDEAAFMTGSELVVDGGFTAH